MTTDNVLQFPLHPSDPIPARDERDWATSQELLTEASITYRQLDYWTRTRLLVPLEAPEPGSGHMRRFSDDQVDRARAIRALLNAGMDTRIIRDHIDAFLTHGHVQIGDITIARTPPGEPA